jgi:transcriptional regulator with XRE-family HTH domain
MNMKERIKMLRKDEKLNQEQFGEKINLSRSAIATLEAGTRKISERNIKAICEKFNVNEKWLRDGVGEMKNETESQTLERLTIEKNLSEIDKEIIEGYIQLNEKERESVQNFILKIADKIIQVEKKEEKSLTSEQKNNA